jgi:hypothetical protein
MFRCIPKSLACFSVWAMSSFLAVPVFAQAATNTPITAPATGWTPANWIALITALGGFIVGIIGAIKGLAAQKTADTNTGRLNAHDGRIDTASSLGAGAQQKADANEQRLNAVSNRLNMHGEQLNNLAQKMPPG